jgi:hypothetical protein
VKDLVIIGVALGAFMLGRFVQFISDARSSMGKGPGKRAERR